MSALEETFYMLKTEAIVLQRTDFIHRRIEEEGFQIIETWHVRPSARDILAMYQGLVPRIATLLRMPYWVGSKVVWLRRQNAIEHMHRVKHQLRREIWGSRWIKGGFLHAPDSVAELSAHERILRRSRLAFEPRDVELQDRDETPVT